MDCPWPRATARCTYLANEPKLSDELREHLAQVVHGYVGTCAPVAARKGVEESFSIDQCVKAHVELCEELLQGSEGAKIAAE